MARGFYDRPYISSGFDNAANMKPFYLLAIDPSCGEYWFSDYKKDNSIIIRFEQNEGTQRTGDRRQVPINLPTTEFEFGAATNGEFNYLADTFATNRLDGEVSIRTYDFENDAWGNYNAIMSINQQDRSTAWNGFEWRPFIISFIDLRSI